MDDWERLPEMDVIFAGAFACSAAATVRQSERLPATSVAWRARF